MRDLERTCLKVYSLEFCWLGLIGLNHKTLGEVLISQWATQTLQVASTYRAQDQNWGKEIKLAFLLLVILFFMPPNHIILNFVPYLKRLRNIDTDLNFTFHVVSMILIFSNWELNKIKYQNRNCIYQTIFYKVSIAILLYVWYLFAQQMGKLSSFACFHL